MGTGGKGTFGEGVEMDCGRRRRGRVLGGRGEGEIFAMGVENVVFGGEGVVGPGEEDGGLGLGLVLVLGGGGMGMGD